MSAGEHAWSVYLVTSGGVGGRISDAVPVQLGSAVSECSEIDVGIMRVRHNRKRGCIAV